MESKVMVYANKKRGIDDSNFQELNKSIQLKNFTELTSMIELVPYFN